MKQTMIRCLIIEVNLKKMFICINLHLGWYVDNGNISNFATSLPKNIAFRPSSTYTIPHEVIIYIFFSCFYFRILLFKDDDGNDDLERIGRSFRDLSRSMCTDGTELFGDLPSPRLNARPT